MFLMLISNNVATHEWVLFYFMFFSELQNVLFFLQLYYYFCDNCFNLF